MRLRPHHPLHGLTPPLPAPFPPNTHTHTHNGSAPMHPHALSSLPHNGCTPPMHPRTLIAQVINADVPKRDYWQVVLGSAAVTQQLSTVISAVAVPVHLRQHSFDAQAVLAVSAALLVVGECCAWGGAHAAAPAGGRRGVHRGSLLIAPLKPGLSQHAARYPPVR